MQLTSVYLVIHEFNRILNTKLVIDLLCVKKLSLETDALVQMECSNKEYISFADSGNFSFKTVLELLKAPILASLSATSFQKIPQ